MKASLVYFAWVRERIGKDEEDLVLPESVVTAGDLLNTLTRISCPSRPLKVQLGHSSYQPQGVPLSPFLVGRPAIMAIGVRPMTTSR